jgi:hypothetical protein
MRTRLYPTRQCHIGNDCKTPSVFFFISLVPTRSPLRAKKLELAVQAERNRYSHRQEGDYHTSHKQYRSPSPDRSGRYRPYPHTRPDSDPNRSFLPNSSSTWGFCALCLSSHTNYLHCNSSTLWNGKPTRCQRSREGRITDKRGRILCTDYQRYGYCSRKGPTHIHECSGCGDKTHGARRCPFAKKD